MSTIRDSIIAAASAVKGETVEAGPTITDALDALADALAGENVDSAPLIADEFAIMAQYLNSGGDSGLDVGPLAMVVVAEGDDKVSNLADLSSGGTAIASFATGADENPAMVAEGVDVRLDLQSVTSNVISAACYNYDSEEDDFLPTAFTDYTAENGVITFTMPAIVGNEGAEGVIDPGWILFSIETLG